MYNDRPSPYLLEHSLLQKAVRRGNVELVEKVFKYLLNNGGRKWLRDRLAVIGYEECWPYADTLDFSCTDYELLNQYKAITCKVKNKDCDGLAYLAKRLNQWNYEAKTGTPEQQFAIQTIADGIKDDIKFWSWIENQPAYETNKDRIEAAKKARKRNVMGKDKSIMLAAAYLSVTYPIPEIEVVDPNNDPNFEYWTVIDKHTGEGEDIIGRVCEQLNIPKHDGYLLAFYFAGALCNMMQESPFFELAKSYKLKTMGFKSLNEAEAKWLELKPLIVQMTKLEVDLMIKRLDNVKDNSDQLDFGF
jgi:hypothetical protein